MLNCELNSNDSAGIFVNTVTILRVPTSRMTTNTSGPSNVYCACCSDCTSCWLALPVTVGGPKRLHIIGATHGLQPRTHTRTLETRYAATHNIHNTRRCSFLSDNHGITNRMQTYLRDFTPASTLSAFTTLLKTYHHPALSPV
jgi:hypothetical protein